MGRDHRRGNIPSLYTGFQSTRPHGARPGSVRELVLCTGFNPRARMGRDRELHLDADTRRVSIHAPAWGATAGDNPGGGARFVSIHAPAWGATRCTSRAPSIISLFQSTRPHGARQVPSAICIPPIMFQSTRPHGARLRRIVNLRTYPRFNPRARMGRDKQ